MHESQVHMHESHVRRRHMHTQISESTKPTDRPTVNGILTIGDALDFVSLLGSVGGNFHGGFVETRFAKISFSNDFLRRNGIPVDAPRNRRRWISVHFTLDTRWLSKKVRGESRGEGKMEWGKEGRED